MAEEKKAKLFREKSLEAVESPEALNDYLKVTSPGVWLILAAVIVLLVGGILWGIFGRITTTAELAVSVRDGQAVCYVPASVAERVMARGRITVDGQEYLLKTDGSYAVAVISEETDAYVRDAGKLAVGDMTVNLPVLGDLADGVYTGTVITESLQPISLLLH